jgi:hypothetical protein
MLDEAQRQVAYVRATSTTLRTAALVALGALLASLLVVVSGPPADSDVINPFTGGPLPRTGFAFGGVLLLGLGLTIAGIRLRRVRG